MGRDYPEWHLSSKGSDDNDGLSYKTAFATFERVLDAASQHGGHVHVWIDCGEYEFKDCVFHHTEQVNPRWIIKDGLLVKVPWWTRLWKWLRKPREEGEGE